jgi:hypothetical protein
MMTFAVLLALFGAHGVKADRETILTAEQVNGTWTNRNGKFHIRALGRQRLQVSFSGVYRVDTPDGLSVSEAVGGGIALIEGDTATFKPDASEKECLITLKFSKDKLVVTQQGTCGFGSQVTAAGTYKKAAGPKIDDGLRL